MSVQTSPLTAGTAKVTNALVKAEGSGKAVIAMPLPVDAAEIDDVPPAFVGDAVSLSVTLSFLSVIAWTVVLGPIGAILAVPMTLFVHAILVGQDPDVIRASLRDYVQPDGELGDFQHAWKVYGRAGSPCERCPGAPACGGVKRIVQSGRSTFFCPRTQL